MTHVHTPTLKTGRTAPGVYVHSRAKVSGQAFHRCVRNSGTSQTYYSPSKAVLRHLHTLSEKPVHQPVTTSVAESATMAVHSNQATLKVFQIGFLMAILGALAIAASLAFAPTWLRHVGAALTFFGCLIAAGATEQHRRER